MKNSKFSLQILKILKFKNNPNQIFTVKKGKYVYLY